MPPERADRLTLLDLHFEGSVLVTTVLRFGPLSGASAASAPLEIYWHVTPTPDKADQYWKVGDGVAYVRKNADYREPERMNGRPEVAGNGQYAWSDFCDVIIALLPTEHTVASARPAAQAKAFGNRLALLWHLQRDPAGRVRVEWELEALRSTLEEEELQINRRYQATYPHLPTPERIRDNERAFVETTDPVGGNKTIIVFNGPTQVGAIGAGAKVTGSFERSVASTRTEGEWIDVAAELARLRLALRQASRTVDQDLIVGDIAAAEQAALQRDEPRLNAYLSRAGKWAFDAATQIGASLTAEAIKVAMRSQGMAI